MTLKTSPAPQGAKVCANGVPNTLQTILSFDVEEHDRIEAAAHLTISDAERAHYTQRTDWSTRWILDQLGTHGARATFFVVGETARDNPQLVKAIHRDGHELASHSWDHRRVHHHTAASFEEDVRKSKDILEQLTGEAVVGYRAPTFSIDQNSVWAIDVLAEQGIWYDSSIYPIRHDRYGVPSAPRMPFVVRGFEHQLLEIPPATLRLGWTNLPVGGGGYFRLYPLFLMRWGLRQTAQVCRPAVAMLYFHPWEFDPEQDRLPLSFLSRTRTYVGIGQTQKRLQRLLKGGRFVSTSEVAAQLKDDGKNLLHFDLECSS